MTTGQGPFFKKVCGVIPCQSQRSTVPADQSKNPERRTHGCQIGIGIHTCKYGTLFRHTCRYQ